MSNIITSQLSFDLESHNWTIEQQSISEVYGLMPNLEITKYCKGCGSNKPRSAFYRNYHRGKYRRNSLCNECRVKESRLWQVKNEEQYRATYRARYARERDKQIIRGVNQRAKALGVSGILTNEQWQDIKQAYNNCCVYCGVSGDSFKLVVDHLWPLSLATKELDISQFATNEVDNIVPACEFCNSAKLNRPFIILIGWKNGLIR